MPSCTAIFSLLASETGYYSCSRMWLMVLSAGLVCVFMTIASDGGERDADNTPAPPNHAEVVTAIA